MTWNRRRPPEPAPPLPGRHLLKSVAITALVLVLALAWPCPAPAQSPPLPNSPPSIANRVAAAAERLQGKLLWQPANPNLGNTPDGRRQPGQILGDALHRWSAPGSSFGPNGLDDAVITSCWGMVLLAGHQGGAVSRGGIRGLLDRAAKACVLGRDVRHRHELRQQQRGRTPEQLGAVFGSLAHQREVMKQLDFGSARRFRPDKAPSRSTINEVKRGDIVVWGSGFHWALATGRQRGGSPEVMSLYNIPEVTAKPENRWTDRYPSMHVQRTSIATLDRGIRVVSLRHARRWKIPLSQVRRQNVRIIDGKIWSKIARGH